MTVSFELYTLVNGRWQIHVRYDEDRREEAMLEAQQLEKESHIERVRVVRDQYDSMTNASRETVIYETVLPGDDKKKKNQAKGRVGSSGAGAERERKKRPPPPGTVKTRKQRDAEKAALEKEQRIQEIEAQRNRRPSAMESMTSGAAEGAAATMAAARRMMKARPNKEQVASGLGKLAVALAVSTLGSLMLTAVAFWALKNLHESAWMTFSNQSTFMAVVVGVFILSFAALFLPLIRRVKFPERGPRAEARSASAEVAAELVQQVPQVVFGPNPELPEIPQYGDGADEDPQQDAEEQPKPKERTADGPQHVKDASGWLLSCMGAALKTIPEQMKSLDAFNRFGLTLFFAGAGDFVGTRYRCDQKQRSDMLTERMQLLGHDENTAFAFCANIDEYLMQPKYLKMYDLGRTAMKNYLDNQGANLKVDSALKDWNKPAATQEEESGSDFVVVLFTDIVNSTAQTQAIGDEGAMEVVRAHNQIIREALTMYRGTEVKHMGDGIMAVFGSVPDSIHAAIKMQLGIDAYCQTTTDRQFRCRIGINAGEPIREGKDFFGTPVQLAARVMSKAGPDQISVSHIVQSMYGGRDVTFSKVGEFELKGFDEPMPIYLVNYRQDAAAAAE